ncbi:hypothetical protein VTN31DRAFT_4292 [Thermomyces dupontii]|uniref:uncharacterized protein n=1 Tax=Talaromyces thermophilus TaxID=28565 RepID=UPI003742F005
MTAMADPAYDPGLLDLIRQTNSRISDAGGTISYQPEHNEAVGLEMADNTLRNGGMTSPVIDIPSRPTPSQQSTTGVPPRPRTRKRGVPRSPDTRRRRRQSNRNSNFRNSSLNDGAGRAKSFICSFRHYGCDSTFGNKNEWKRHINTQHIKQAFWRCNQGSCDVSRQQPQQPRVPNDFNRKDLFMQHLRRMHAPWGRARLPSPHERDQFERHIILVTNQCHVHLRNPPPRSRCGFCSSTFTNWETRLEHVGRHYEQQQQASRTSSGSDTSGEGQEEVEDPDLRDWALREGVIRWDSATQRLVMC